MGSFLFDRLEGPQRHPLWIIENQIGRRNLIPAQRAELAFKSEEIVKAKAREKQRATQFAGRDKTGKPVNLRCGPHVGHTEGSFRTRDQLAAMAGVSKHTIDRGRAIFTRGSEDLQERVRSGQTSLSAGFKELKEEEGRSRKAEKAKGTDKKPARACKSARFMERAEWIVAEDTD